MKPGEIRTQDASSVVQSLLMSVYGRELPGSSSKATGRR